MSLEEAERIATYRPYGGGAVSVFKVGGMNHVVTYISRKGIPKDIFCLGQEHAMVIFDRCKAELDEDMKFHS